MIREFLHGRLVVIMQVGQQHAEEQAVDSQLRVTRSFEEPVFRVGIDEESIAIAADDQNQGQDRNRFQCPPRRQRQLQQQKQQDRQRQVKMLFDRQ